MYTPLISVQRLEKSGNINVSSLSGDLFQWTLVTNSKPTNEDKEYFPIRANGDFKVNNRGASHETTFEINKKRDTFRFTDSYLGPQGAIFIIVLPESFIVDVLTFRDKPMLPVNVQGNIISQIPGSLQVAYNNSTKRNCIAITLYQTIGFELILAGKKVIPKSFPKSESLRSANPLFDISLSTEFLKVDHITNEDLMLINSTAAINIDQVRDAFQEMLLGLKNRDIEKSDSALKKIKMLLINGLNSAGAIVTLIDSYNNSAGIVHSFIAQVLKIIFFN